MEDQSSFEKEIAAANNIAELIRNGKIQESIGQLPPHEAEIVRLKMKLIELQLKEYNSKKIEKRLDFLKAIALVVTGASLTYFLQKDPIVSVTNQVPFAKIQIFHDTFFLANTKNNPDTSLVRLVK